MANAYRPAPLGGARMAPINNSPVSIRFHSPGTSSILDMPHLTAAFWFSTAALPKGKRRVWGGVLS